MALHLSRARYGSISSPQSPRSESLMDLSLTRIDTTKKRLSRPRFAHTMNGNWRSHAAGITIVVLYTKVGVIVDESDRVGAGAFGMGGVVKGEEGEWEKHSVCLKPTATDGALDSTAAPGFNPFLFAHKTHTPDCDHIIVPAGRDSLGEITMLRDGFESEAWGEAWEDDLAPYAPSSSVPAIDENCMDVPLLDSSISASFNTTRKTAMESPRVPPTRSDPATAVGATRDIVTTARTIPPATPSTSTSNSSASPTGTVSLQKTADPLVHTDTLEIPSSTPLGPVLDDIAGTSPWPTSAPELGTAKVDPATHANTLALDLSPQPTAIDITIAYSSEKGIDVEQTSDRLLHTSPGQYDIV
ncbi:hypothetical protein EI94DRAFT_1702686 [Lactarius quietus]|nr:hypothetical protein EI94DRAFT_1702686 [Lactarius quietus]